jgi:hypothetical protein
MNAEMPEYHGTGEVPPTEHVYQHLTLDQVIAYVAKRWGDRPQSHRHQWAILEVQHPQTEAVHPRVQISNHTVVLLKCHCGEPMTVTLAGFWTMKQLMDRIGEQIATTQARSKAVPSEDAQPSGEYPPG